VIRLQTPLCDRLEIDYPIFSPELAAAVSNAGGLGVLGLSLLAETGIDLEALMAVSEWLEVLLGHRLEGHLYRAGTFAPVG
jgi:NAD(P)H-dependent flavin oxidoreductase YrpB (nitropropane dioxygenase family)